MKLTNLAVLLLLTQTLFAETGGGGHESSGGGHYVPGVAKLVVNCGDLTKQWPTLKQEMKAQFDLAPQCDGVSGHFAQAAWILKAHFPKYYQEIKDNVKVIEIRNEALHFAAYTWRKEAKIALYPAFGNTEVETAIALLVHEGAHLKIDAPDHVRCVGGAYKGQLACDQRFTGDLTDGPYSYELELLLDMGIYLMEHEGFDLLKIGRIGKRLRFLYENKFNVIDVRKTLPAKVDRALSAMEEYARRREQ